jgi:hypothetical protein
MEGSNLQHSNDNRRKSSAPATLFFTAIRVKVESPQKWNWKKKNWQQCQTSEVVLGVATTLLVVKNSTLWHSISSFSFFPFQALLARSTQPLDGKKSWHFWWHIREFKRRWLELGIWNRFQLCLKRICVKSYSKMTGTWRWHRILSDQGIGK